MRKLLLMLALAAFGAAAIAPAEAFMDRPIRHYTMLPFLPVAGGPPLRGPVSRYTTIPSCAGRGFNCGYHKSICVAWARPIRYSPNAPLRCARWQFIY